MTEGEIPATIDRYQVVARLGAGGMGVVYEARDPELDRPVALKLLHRLGDGSDATSTARRLVREGQALAQLNHPNVVQVFGAGLDDGRVWLAMELVRGQTLKQWAAADRRSWREVLAVLEPAGRGLAAAHATNLVHRDFKPANVLVGEDGRVRVLDFGLARPAEDREPSAQELAETERPDSRSEHRVLDLAVTKTGAVVGTPRYMAPEQMHGLPADPRSDQFAFAVTAWQLLHGRAPFEARSAFDRLQAIEHAEFGPTAAGVPRRLTRALQRALSYRAERRFPTMDALLSALSPASHHRRTATGVVGCGLVTLWAAIVIIQPDFAASRSADCSAATTRAHLARVWNPERRESVLDGLRVTRAPWAEATATAVDAEVESFSTHWSTVFQGACGSATSAGLHRQVGFPLSQHACLLDRLVVLDAVLTRLESADRGVAENAAKLVRSVSMPDACVYERADNAESRRSAELRQQLARATAAKTVGDASEAVAQGKTVAAEARSLGLTVLEGDALSLVGDALFSQDEATATRFTTRAYELAVAAGMDFRAVDRAQSLAAQHARLGRSRSAKQWLRHAEVALQRSGRRPDLDAAQLLVACRLFQSAGEYGTAVQKCKRAVELAGRVPGATRAVTWNARASLARAYGRVGNFDAARRINLELRGEAVEALGHDHPRAGGMEMNLGTIANAQGRIADAEQHYARARDVFVNAYGPRSGWVVSALMNLAAAHSDLGMFDAAAETLGQALELAADTADLRQARVLNNFGHLRNRQGRHGEALELLRRAEALEDVLLGPDHPQTAYTQLNLAAAFSGLGLLEDAVVHVRRAIDRWKKAGEWGRVTSALLQVAYYEATAGDTHRSRDTYAEALALARSIDASGSILAQCLGPFAHVLLDVGELDEASDAIEEGLRVTGPLNPESAIVIAQLLHARGRLMGMNGASLAANQLGLRALAAAQTAVHPLPKVETKISDWLTTL